MSTVEQQANFPVASAIISNDGKLVYYHTDWIRLTAKQASSENAASAIEAKFDAMVASIEKRFAAQQSSATSSSVTLRSKTHTYHLALRMDSKNSCDCCGAQRSERHQVWCINASSSAKASSAAPSINVAKRYQQQQAQQQRAAKQQQSSAAAPKQRQSSEAAPKQRQSSEAKRAAKQQREAAAAPEQNGVVQNAS